MTDTLASAQQRLEVGAFIELFTLDVSSLGGGILYWTPSRPQAGSPIVWQGNTYASVDIVADGFEKSASGPLPRPRLSVGNADNVVGALLSLYDDILGCVVTRTRTLSKFLDGEPEADPTAEWPKDIYRVERKLSHNKNVIVLELAAAMDNAGAMIPGRVVLRDVCTHIYRRWNGSELDYTLATCPYAGTACFNAQGTPTVEESDVCGKRISDCKLRFGAQAELPYAGFPGVARVRV